MPDSVPDFTPAEERTLRSSYTALMSLRTYPETFAPYTSEVDEIHVKNLVGSINLCERKLR
jgi:hypothetical protein